MRKSGISYALAWGVHLLTAGGAVFCLLALRAAAAGRFRETFLWLGAAVIVDGVDGSLARYFEVKKLLPGFDGALLDNIVDYNSYVLVPAFLLLKADLLAPSVTLWAAGAICMASAYQFCRADAKTSDHFFTGFPSYWNIVVFYLFLLKLGEAVNLAIILALCVLVFVPVKYVYPTRTPYLRKTTLVLCVLWAVAIGAMLYLWPSPSLYLVWSSVLYVLYYAVLSLYLTLKTQKTSAP